MTQDPPGRTFRSRSAGTARPAVVVVAALGQALGWPALLVLREAELFAAVAGFHVLVAVGLWAGLRAAQWLVWALAGVYVVTGLHLYLTDGLERYGAVEAGCVGLAVGLAVALTTPAAQRWFRR